MSQTSDAFGKADPIDIDSAVSVRGVSKEPLAKFAAGRVSWGLVRRFGGQDRPSAGDRTSDAAF